MPRYRQVRTEHGWDLILVGNHQPAQKVHIVGAQKEFKSPITGEVITSRVGLREHNKRNNVVHESEFGAEGGKAWFEKAEKKREQHYLGTDPEQRADRKKDLLVAMEKHLKGEPHG